MAARAGRGAAGGRRAGGSAPGGGRVGGGGGAARRGLRARARGLWLQPVGDGDHSHLLTAEGEAPPAPAVQMALRPGPAILGRDEAADLVVSVPTVSGAHARLDVKAEGAGVTVTDLGSTNGTLVNGEVWLEEGEGFPLAVGDEVSFGDENLASFKLIFLPE